MIIQRKIELDVPSGNFTYWEDLVTSDSTVINPLAYLKTLNHPTGTEYRIIHTAGIDMRTAIVTQPPAPKKKVEWLKSE